MENIDNHHLSYLLNLLYFCEELTLKDKEDIVSVIDSILGYKHEL